MYDVVIVGGGPAGLNAALVLGRCRRRTLVCDAGQPRNARSRALHGYLTRDGTPPLHLNAIGRDELRPYNVEVRAATVVDVRPLPEGFEVSLEGGGLIPTRAVLLATGVRDTVPDIPGLDACYGISVHHCPYCDGWEARDKVIAVLAERGSPAPLALALKTWSDTIVVCSSGRGRVRAAHRQQLVDHGIPLYESPITRVEHESGQVTGIVLVDGCVVRCEAVFFSAPQGPQRDLARRVGCEFNRRGTVKTDHLGQTCVPGIYVVGDASRDVQFAIVAAAEGAKAGVAINKALQARAGLAAATA